MKLFAVLLFSILHIYCIQTQPEGKNININTRTNVVNNSGGPKTITRNIIQDKKGNIWMAAFDGVFRYDGKSFVNITLMVSSARFFSILEDQKGVLWFGTIGSGAYRYDGKNFQNITTKDGLLNNEVGNIYEDKKGNIWFGVSGGASCYDGKSFRNYIKDGNMMKEDLAGKTFSDRQPEEVNDIIEDRYGRFWFATRGNTYVYDGKTSTVFTHDDKAFKNVRTIIEDKKGNIWLSGNDGLWKYTDGAFANYTQRFTGYIMEDRQGNIWTSSEKDLKSGWTLSKYDGKTLNTEKPTVIEIAGKQMIFGIFEAKDGSIWFGHLDGVSRYDGKTVVDFKDKEGME